MDQESNKDHYFSGPGEFGLNPIRTGSSQGGGFPQKSCPFTFDNSGPSRLLSAFNSGYSLPRYKDGLEPSFDTFSRAVSDVTGQSNSKKRIWTSFDSQTPSGDSDAFGSSPFRTPFDGQTPRRDSDPFGSSGPFRTSMETPRKD
ncbi:hypothetical protein DVH24_010108 [Malus domestica]|uniref:Uncharacterized protein n=1 Tax=Malus domestica TaxID=3750 RepID=A0A498JV19_MALDO|nr:hypothetical protein DVH24_010108 [Malus domestica]